jgi:hypothetical protein
MDVYRVEEGADELGLDEYFEAIPFVIVVLPAPKSPVRTITSPACAFCPMI